MFVCSCVSLWTIMCIIVYISIIFHPLVNISVWNAKLDRENHDLLLDDATSCLFSIHHGTQWKFNHKIYAKEKLQITNGMFSFVYIFQMYTKIQEKINSTPLWVFYEQCSSHKIILAIIILKVVKISSIFSFDSGRHSSYCCPKLHDKF